MVFFCKIALSQTSNSDSLQYSIDKKNRVGVNFSLGNSFTKLELNDISTKVYADSLNSITRSNSPYVLQAGGLYEMELSNNFIFRPMFLVCFETMNLTYNKKNGVETIEVMHFGFNVPLHILCQTKGKNIKGYILGGPSFNLGLGADNKTKNKIDPKQFDIIADIGIGIKKTLKHISIMPEVKFSQGLLNIKGTNKNIYTDPIKGLYRQNLWFGIVFTAN